MSSWAFMGVDGIPVVAKVGGSEQGKESMDPVKDIQHGHLVWLTGHQVHELQLQEGERVQVHFPDIGLSVDGTATNYVGPSKMIDLDHQLNLSLGDAEAVAYPAAGTIRRWHGNDVEPGKTTWREMVKRYPRAKYAVFPQSLEPGT